MTGVGAVPGSPDPSWAASELIERAEACTSLTPAWLAPLAALDPGMLTPDDRVTLTLVMQRMTAVTEALALRALASVPTLSCKPDPALRDAHPDAAARMCPGGPRCDHRWEVDELSALTGLPRHLMGRRRGLAWQLASMWPELMPLLAGGRITLEHLHRFHLATLNANEAAMAAAVAAFLDLVERQPYLPVERLARAARRAVARHTPPAEAKDNAERTAREQTGVSFEALSDGLAALTLTGPAHQLEAIRALLADHPAITHPDPDDTRTKGQRQLDLLIGLCLTGSGYGANTGPLGPDAAARSGWAGTSEAAEPAVGVVITASLETLCGLSNEPGLVGNTITSAAIIRQWATDPAWARRAIIDAAGQITSVSRKQRFPAGRLKQAVQLRWQRCTFPGCNRPAQQSQLDHAHDHAHGGDTTLAHLHPLCPKHHRMKDLPGVHLHLTPDGTAVWTMPSGRTIHVPAPDHAPHPGPHDNASENDLWEPPPLTWEEAIPDALYHRWITHIIAQDPENQPTHTPA